MQGPKRTTSGQLKKNSSHKSHRFPRSSVLLSTLSPVNTHAHLCIRELLTHVLGIDTVSWPFCDADASFHFHRSATNTAKRLPECVVCKKNARQRCPSSLRTDRLLPASHENENSDPWHSPRPKNERPVFVQVKQWHAMTTSHNLVTLL